MITKILYVNYLTDGMPQSHFNINCNFYNLPHRNVSYRKKIKCVKNHKCFIFLLLRSSKLVSVVQCSLIFTI